MHSFPVDEFLPIWRKLQDGAERIEQVLHEFDFFLVARVLFLKVGELLEQNVDAVRFAHSFAIFLRILQ